MITAEWLDDTDLTCIRQDALAQLTADAPEDGNPHSERECEDPEAFIPDTAEKVDWVLSKIAAHRAAAKRIRENGELMARAEDRAAERLLWQFNEPMQAWAKAQTEGTRKKSVTLYHGVLGFRTRPAGIDFEADVARAWAFTAAPDALRIDRTALTKQLTVNDTGQVVAKETGEVITFATATPAEDVFFVK